MDMIERVARAILSRVPFGYGMTENEAREYARAAIAAMREPTKGMRRAFTAVHFNEANPDKMVPLTGTGQGDLTMVKAYEDVWFVLSMDERWKSMIDAALEEDKTDG